MAALMLLASGCHPNADPEVERIELRRSGWSSLDVSVDAGGQGAYAIDGPRAISGTFRLKPGEFATLVERLAPYRRQSVARTEARIRQMMKATCPPGIARVSDAGAVYLRWIGRGMDRHYLAVMGCAIPREVERNEDLQRIVRSLPVPHR